MNNPSATVQGIRPDQEILTKQKLILPANSGHQEVMQRAGIHSVVGLSSHTQNGGAFYCS